MSEYDIFPCMYEWLSDMDVSLAGNLKRWADNEVMAKRLELKEELRAAPRARHAHTLSGDRPAAPAVAG